MLKHGDDIWLGMKPSSAKAGAAAAGGLNTGVRLMFITVTKRATEKCEIFDKYHIGCVLCLGLAMAGGHLAQLAKPLSCPQREDWLGHVRRRQARDEHRDGRARRDQGSVLRPSSARRSLLCAGR